jgi:glycosyltransferase involved in cell wall biosynthesis
MTKISVVSPIYNEVHYIEQFIEVLLSQKVSEEIEFILVDGASSDGTTAIIEKFVKVEPRAKLVLNPQKITPISMNLGIKNSSGEIIVRMDVHASYPSNYISKLTEALNTTKADNVGSVIETVPGDKTELAKVIAFVMSHPLGVGPSNFRTGNFTMQEVDTVPFGCYRREVFDRIGFYDEDLIRSQDDELNARLIKAGGKILLVPDLKIQYFGRKNLSQLWRMFYQYGYSKPLVNKKLKKAATIRQFAPPVFVLGSFISVLFFFISFEFLAILFWLVYFGAISYVCSKKYTFFSKKFFIAIASFLTVHFSYGLGYLKGIGDFWIFGKKKMASSTNISR